MKLLKWLVGILLAYVVFVIVFEAGYLGWSQPSFEESGIPMLVITTTDESGESRPRMLASFATNNKLYVSAHHWPRGWYKRAIANPNVTVEIGGEIADYLAVPVDGSEFDEVAEAHPLPFMVRFLMGFPPERDILRLDPVVEASALPQS